MTTKELRDKLIEQRTIYQNSVAESEKACEQLKQSLLSLKEDKEAQSVVMEYGFDLTRLLNVEVDRLMKDEDYLEQFKQALHSTAEQLQKMLEHQLEV